MKVKQKLLLLVLVLAVGSTASAQIITNVVRANGDSGAAPLATEAGGLKDGNLVFSDRTYVWAETDTGTLGSANQPLIGSEYIRTYNNDKNSGGAGVSYTVTTSTMAAVWFTVDDRFADPQGQANAIATLIGPAGTFTDTGLQLHVGGDSDPPGRPLSVFAAELGPGTYVFGPSQGNNFYVIGAVIADVTFNPAPTVDAGPDQAGYLADTFQLNGTVTDYGSADGTSSLPGVASFYWTQRGGAGTAQFSATDILDPTVTFTAAGTYELMLRAFDIDGKDANDIMTVLVQDPQMVGYWPFDGDALDNSVSSNDGTLMGGAFIDTTDAAVGAGSVNVIGLTPTDPNMPHVDLGEARDLNFSITNWTVAAWVKTIPEAGRGAIFNNGGDTSGGHRYTLFMGEGNSNKTTLTLDDNASKREAKGGTIINDGIWHFVVGMRVGNESRVYVDGVLDATQDLPDGYDLSGTSQFGSQIGVGIDWNGSVEESNIQKHLDALIDDVRVYNYDLSLDDIRGLAGMGELPPVVDAGPDIVVQLKPGEKIILAAIAEDYGTPGPLGISWTTEADLSVGEAIFTDATVAAAEVEFPLFGVYVLTLTADDGIHDPVSDSVQIEVVSPTCADVISEGLLMVGDISGPDGTPDCRVNLIDFAVLAKDWMNCNDPSDPECIYDPYNVD